MKYIFTKSLVVILIFLGNSFISRAEIILDRFEDFRFKPILIFGAGFPFGSSSDEFFNIYKEEIGGKEDYARHTPTIAIGYKTWLSKQTRIGVSANFINTSFYDEFNSGGIYISRQHFTDIAIQTIPILVSGELIPYDKQFRSYIGGSIGVTASHISWKERVISSYTSDKRKSAVHFSEAILIPTVRLFSGIELGFDEFPESAFLGSVIFEFNYTYSHRNIDIFKNIKKQMTDYSSVLDNKVLLFPGYFNFTVALSFNLLPKR